MSLRRALVLLPLLIAAGCGADPRPALPPPPLVLEGMPPAVAAPAKPAPPGAAAVDDRFAREQDGWRATFRLSLPALSEPAGRRCHRAALSWLFQDFEVLPGGVAASGAAALTRLVAEHPSRDGVSAAGTLDRAVVGVRVGALLSLTRTLSERTGNGGPVVREEALIIDAFSGKALDLDAVVPPARQAALRETLVAALRRSRAPAAGERELPIPLPIPLPTLDDDGARFVWNPSELADAGEGAFVVELPRDSVRGLFAIDPWAK